MSFGRDSSGVAEPKDVSTCLGGAIRGRRGDVSLVPDPELVKHGKLTSFLPTQVESNPLTFLLTVLRSPCPIRSDTEFSTPCPCLPRFSPLTTPRVRPREDDRRNVSLRVRYTLPSSGSVYGPRRRHTSHRAQERELEEDFPSRGHEAFVTCVHLVRLFL